MTASRDLRNYPIEYLLPLDDPYYKKEYKDGGRFIYNDNLKFERIDGAHTLIVTEYIIKYTLNKSIVIFVILDNKLSARQTYELLHFDVNNAPLDIMKVVHEIFMKSKSEAKYIHKNINVPHYDKFLNSILKSAIFTEMFANFEISNIIRAKDPPYFVINNRHNIFLRKEKGKAGFVVCGYYDFGVTLPARMLSLIIHPNKVTITESFDILLHYIFMEHSYKRSLAYIKKIE